MRLAICTLQRNRGPWLKEWVAFHYLVGFRKFFIFTHQTTDQSPGVINSLKVHFDISAFQIADSVANPKLGLYHFIYENHNHEFDWISFLDGDEFLFSPRYQDLREPLERFTYSKLSALAIYRAHFGSALQSSNTSDFITDQFRMRAPLNFSANHSYKSMVMGRQGNQFGLLGNPYGFKTIQGTVDENLQSIETAPSSHDPSFSMFRINRYSCHHSEQFLYHEGLMMPPGVPSDAVRSTTQWMALDRNDELDQSLQHLAPKLPEIIKYLL